MRPSGFGWRLPTSSTGLGDGESGSVVPPFSHWLLINYSLLNPELRGTRFSDDNAEGRAGRGLAEAPVSEASAPALPWTTSGCPAGAQQKGWRKAGAAWLLRVKPGWFLFTLQRRDLPGPAGNPAPCCGWAGTPGLAGQLPCWPGGAAGGRHHQQQPVLRALFNKTPTVCQACCAPLT